MTTQSASAESAAAAVAGEAPKFDVNTLNGQVLWLSLGQIVVNEAALRACDQENEEFKGVLESVRAEGIHQNLLVAPVDNYDPGDPKYLLVDGLQRFTCATILSIPKVLVKVVVGDEYKRMCTQIHTNANRVSTRPAQYAHALRRMLALRPTLTLKELAVQVGLSQQTIEARLTLVKLIPEIQELVDGGKIKLLSAIALAKLPKEEQPDFLDQALTLDAGEFVPLAETRVREVAAASRQGRVPGPKEFTPQETLRRPSAVKAELATREAGNTLLAQTGETDPYKVWDLAIRWALTVDPIGAAEQKTKFEQRRQEQDEQRQRRRLERATTTQASAAQLADELRRKLGMDLAPAANAETVDVLEAGDVPLDAGDEAGDDSDDDAGGDEDALV